MTTFDDLPADIIFVIALLLHPTDLYSLALLASRYARIIKNRNVINYHLKEINKMGINVYKIKYFVLKHTGKRHGLYESWYDNGQKCERINYQNGKKHGLYENWYHNGQKFEQINYRNGEKHGLCESWYENGQKQLQFNRENNKLHGLYESWYQNGQKFEQINHQNGIKHGLYESWYQNGLKCKQINYQNDEIVNVK